VWALVWGTLVTQTLKAIGLNLLVATPRRPRFSLTAVRPLLRFGSHMTVTQLLWVAFSQSDMLIGGRLLGKEALGVYSVAMHLASLPIQRIAGIVNQIAFPAFARLQGDIARVGVMCWGHANPEFHRGSHSVGISSVAPRSSTSSSGRNGGPPLSRCRCWV